MNMLVSLKILLTSIVVLIVGIGIGSLSDSNSISDSKSNSSFQSRPFIRIKLSNILDTIFTAKDSYLTVNLKTQRLLHHFRDGRTFEYLCSTGNPNIEEGVITNEGIFVIQYKSKKVYSTQFDSTLLLNWMGFNYGIGIHALNGSAYYRTLGKRAASHGCVRVGREDCQKVYDNVEIGTVIMVHSENNARIISFTDDIDRFISPSKKEIAILSERNLGLLYSGRVLIRETDKMIISEDNISHPGISIGNLQLIPNSQYYIPPVNLTSIQAADRLKIHNWINRNYDLNIFYEQLLE